jgi:hypothetical protein
MSKAKARATLVALTAIALLALVSTQGVTYTHYRSASAADGCVQCHPTFRSFGALHSLHTGFTTTCSACHVNTGDIPSMSESGADPNYGCNGCHVGAGNRLHHINAGAPPDGNGLLCSACHGNDPAPDPENVPPPFYGSALTPLTDPCETDTALGGEDYSGDNLGLDNDGDLLYDSADPDCETVPVDPDTWGAIKDLFR